MPRVMKLTALLTTVAAVLTLGLFLRFRLDIFLTLAITFGTTAYHFGTRLLVGLLFSRGMNNRADYTKGWYQLRPWEDGLYRALKVKTWKGKLPSYYPETFSPKEHTWDEIAQAMCQSELVHEVNVVLSFVPLAASVWFGSFSVFLMTSLCGAGFDLLFVMMQRFNRPRIIKIAQRVKERDP